MMNSLKHSLLSTVDEFLSVLGLERRYGIGRRMTPAFGWLVVGAAAGGATAAWLMSDAGQDFLKTLRGRVQKSADELKAKRTGDNGVGLSEPSASHGESNANRTHARTVA